MGVDSRFNHRFKCEHCGMEIEKELVNLCKRNPLYQWVIDSCFYKNKDIVSRYDDGIVQVEVNKKILDDMYNWVYCNDKFHSYLEDDTDWFEDYTLSCIQLAIDRCLDGDIIIFIAEW